MEKIKVVLIIKGSGTIKKIINSYVTRNQLNLLQFLQDLGAFDYDSEVDFEKVEEFPAEDLTEEY